MRAAAQRSRWQRERFAGRSAQQVLSIIVRVSQEGTLLALRSRGVRPYVAEAWLPRSLLTRSASEGRMSKSKISVGM